MQRDRNKKVRDSSVWNQIQGEKKERQRQRLTLKGHGDTDKYLKNLRIATYSEAVIIFS